MSTGTPAAEPPPVVAATAADARLHRVYFGEAGFALDVFEGHYSTHAWDVGGVLQQYVELPDTDPLRILVRAGEGETLGSVRREHAERGDPVERAEPLEICGRPAHGIVVEAPEEFIECIEYADGRPSSPGYIPATTTVVRHFRHKGLDVTVSWELPTDLRPAFRRHEDRVFASIDCAAVGPDQASLR